MFFFEGKKMLHYFATITLFLLTSSIALSDTEELETKVAKILKRTPLIDGHNDLPILYTMRANGDLSKLPFRGNLEITSRPTHTDLARMRRGMVGAQFWSVFIPINKYGGEAGDTGKVLKQIDIVHRLVKENQSDLEIALTADDILRIHSEGKIASLIGIEGGHAIENSLATLRMLYELGARYMTLTHSKGLSWADSATDVRQVGGLTEFGVEVVKEMNRIGMLVDLSHVSNSTMNQALDASSSPVIFSHSSAASVTRHPRNVSDELLLRLKENSGIIMITFFPSYISQRVDQAWKDIQEKAKKTPGTPEERRKFFFEEVSSDLVPKASIKDVADHIDHVRNLIGSDFIGLGSDYDGMPGAPTGLEDVSKFPALFVELLRRGYSEAEIEKIAGKNLLRVMR
ncbi:MAG: membrane dipeptidase, partial [Gammaproteobacteria bacterium]|nr:membrane dipeptidase [Gammaproteobacteria bacterium]